MSALLLTRPRPIRSPLEVVSGALNSFFVKRVLDVVVASAVLLLVAPLILFVAVLVKLRDWGPVFFAQQRVGLNGMPFTCYKIRSMSVDAEQRRAEFLNRNVHGDGITFKLKGDPRVTWIGRIIRKLSIDELPQLWNILKGDMSLVGPRPAVPAEVARYSPEQLARLGTLPGLTCFWQVQGRAKLPFEDQVRLDILYIRTRTLWLDIRLLFQTIPAVLTCRGAY